MEKLRFNDNHVSEIVRELKNVYNEIATIKNLVLRDEYSKEPGEHFYTMFDDFVDDTKCEHINDYCCFNNVAGEFLAGDFDDDGSYIYSLSSKYKAKRIVEFSNCKLQFCVVKWTSNLYSFTRQEYDIHGLLRKELLILDYILKYSYRANKKVKPAKRPKRNGVLTPKAYLNKKYGYIDTDNVGGGFDDYPSFIGSFAQPNPIPCDGDVE